ncbi:MAG: hypothetical protein RLN67_05445, partial [Algiphilus sp.]
WDKERDTIVSNESAEIIRMFNTAFNAITGNHDDYYPEALRAEIDAVNQASHASLLRIVGGPSILVCGSSTSAALDKTTGNARCNTPPPSGLITTPSFP